MQLTHYNSNFSKRRIPITLVSDNVTNAPNIGSLFRIADAFGIEKLILCGKEITIGKKTSKTSRATEKAVAFELSKNTLEVVKTLKNNNYQIIALEITSKSESLYRFQLKTKQPIALVVGDENFGISEDILNISDAVIHLDMFGQNSSMNVVQATSIALFELTRQLI
jgi:tRNA G18 (ribose-2'-O)-methylase SpoU